MFTTHLSAIGVYATATQAEVGVNVLIENGFNSEGIHLLLPEQRNTQSFPGQPINEISKLAGHQERRHSAAIGATAGSLLLGALGVLAGAGALHAARWDPRRWSPRGPARGNRRPARGRCSRRPGWPAVWHETATGPHPTPPRPVRGRTDAAAGELRQRR